MSCVLKWCFYLCRYFNQYYETFNLRLRCWYLFFSVQWKKIMSSDIKCHVFVIMSLCDHKPFYCKYTKRRRNWCNKFSIFMGSVGSVNYNHQHQNGQIKTKCVLCKLASLLLHYKFIKFNQTRSSNQTNQQSGASVL